MSRKFTTLLSTGKCVNRARFIRHFALAVKLKTGSPPPLRIPCYCPDPINIPDRAKLDTGPVDPRVGLGPNFRQIWRVGSSFLECILCLCCYLLWLYAAGTHCITFEIVHRLLLICSKKPPTVVLPHLSNRGSTDQWHKIRQLELAVVWFHRHIWLLVAVADHMLLWRTAAAVVWLASRRLSSFDMWNGLKSSLRSKRL